MNILGIKDVSVWDTVLFSAFCSVYDHYIGKGGRGKRRDDTEKQGEINGNRGKE